MTFGAAPRNNGRGRPRACGKGGASRSGADIVNVDQAAPVHRRQHRRKSGALGEIGHHVEAGEQDRIGLADLVIKLDDARPQRIAPARGLLQQPGADEFLDIAIAGRAAVAERLIDLVGTPRRPFVREQVENRQHPRHAAHATPPLAPAIGLHPSNRASHARSPSSSRPSLRKIIPSARRPEMLQRTFDNTAKVSLNLKQ